MIKTIQIDKRAVEFNTALSWMILYKSQFGQDPIEIVMPALEQAVPLIADLQDKGLNFNDLTEEDISVFMDIIGRMNAVDMLQLIWTLARNADNTITDPESWFNQFDVFPLDDVFTEILPALMQSCISVKKYKALSGKLSSRAKPKKKQTSKVSSQVDLREDSSDQTQMS